MSLQQRWLSGAAAVLAVAMSASACADTSRPTSAKIVVTPATGLHDGQQVEVSISGFPNLPEKVFLSECSSANAVNNEGCGEQLAGQVFFLTDTNGASRGPFVVHNSAATGPMYAPQAACTTSCVLVATVGAVQGVRSVAWAALSFVRG